MSVQDSGSPDYSTIDRRMLVRLSAAALAGLAVPGIARAQGVRPAPEVLHSAPTGTFFENLEAQADGSVLFTSYFAKEILRWSTQGISTFAKLNAHPVDLVSLQGEVVVTAHGAPFTSGPDFVKSMRIIRLGLDGKVRSTQPADKARFLNGVIADGTGAVLIADSLAGMVWSQRLGSTTLEPFLTNEVLKPVVAKEGEFALGVNGIKIHNGYLYISNSSTTTLHRVALVGGKPSGVIETVAKFAGIDDFAIADDGRIFVATHRNDVVMRRSDGTIEVLADQKAEGATAVAFGLGPSAGALFVTTTGGLFAGLKADANLIRISVPKR